MLLKFTTIFLLEGINISPVFGDLFKLLFRDYDVAFCYLLFNGVKVEKKQTLPPLTCVSILSLKGKNFDSGFQRRFFDISPVLLVVSAV